MQRKTKYLLQNIIPVGAIVVIIDQLLPGLKDSGGRRASGVV